MAATEKFDMIPVRGKAQFDPQPWDGTETKLPGVCENGGYFLKANAGEKFAVGGTVVKPLATRKETNGKFSVYCVEGSSLSSKKGLDIPLKFEDTHHAIYTATGVVKTVIDGIETTSTSGETTFVPAGTSWRFAAKSAYAKMYIFANGGGIGEVLASVATKYELAGVPQLREEVTWDEKKIKSLESKLKFTAA
jgi:quercetin dioxygenase-like cupin family protein